MSERFVSRRHVILGEVERAFTRSVRQAAQLAERKAPRRSGRLRGSGHVERRGLFRARIVFDAPYATAQEKGAFITPRRGKTLHFKVGGRWVSVKAVRLRAQPYLRPAGDAWPRLFTEELRRESRS